MSYAIDADFRSMLRSLMAFEDPDLANTEKLSVFYGNLYLDPPENVKAGMERAIWFLNAGAEERDLQEGPRVFSWAKDSNLIFAAFQQTHGIDLQAVEFLHWWKFLALFMDLGSQTVFCSLIGLRKRIKTGKATKEEKTIAREMGSGFEVEEIDDRTLEEKEAERRFLEEIKRYKNGR